MRYDSVDDGAEKLDELAWKNAEREAMGLPPYESAEDAVGPKEGE